MYLSHDRFVGAISVRAAIFWIGPISKRTLIRVTRLSPPHISRRLQVLEAWCTRATAFAQCGLALQSGFPVSSATRDHHGDGLGVTQTLSEVMGAAMKALVHPAKLISSLAPALLEHVVNLRHVSKTGCGVFK